MMTIMLSKLMRWPQRRLESDLMYLISNCEITAYLMDSNNPNAANTAYITGNIRFTFAETSSARSI